MSENKSSGQKRRGGSGGPGGGPGHMGIVEKPKNFRKAVKRILSTLRPWRVRLLITVVLSALSAALSILGPKILGQATTEVFTGLVAKVQGRGGINFDRIAQIMMVMLGLYLISGLFSFVMQRLAADVSVDLSRKMRRDIGEKLHRVPVSYYEKANIGDILSRITNDVDAVSQSISNVLTQFISGVATLLGVLVMMLTISPLLTGIVVLVVPLSGVMVAVIFKLSQKYFRAQQETLGEISGQVEESYGAHAVVQVFRQEGRSMETFAEKNGKLYESAWKSQFFTGLMMPITTFVGNLGYLLVAVFGAAQAAMGRISVGDIQAFIQYVRSFMQPISQFAQVTGQLQTMAAAAERVFDFLDAEEEQEPETDKTMGEIKGRVCFEHVRFGYDTDKEIIHDFSLCVLPGQTCAIVGETGSGKTTLVKLLMRFYDPQGGFISLDGENITDMPRAEVRRNIGMVLQDTWLFSGTIMENIRYGRPEATDEEVYEAARLAHADHFIRTLPKGYEMEINEEADNLSSGQKQLLTIARAVLADKPLMILDEATSNVDTLTEHRIQRAMSFLMKGRTSFVIAHRLSTIRGADMILVMEEGGIAEFGSHDELMQKGGLYKSLYESQFEPT